MNQRHEAKAFFNNCPLGRLRPRLKRSIHQLVIYLDISAHDVYDSLTNTHRQADAA
jgi:hypothetical protein